jgi:hypothetical protein
MMDADSPIQAERYNASLMSSNLKSQFYVVSQMSSKNFLSNITPHNVEHRKKLMMRKVDELIDQNK